MAELPAPITFTWSLAEARALSIAQAELRGNRFGRFVLFTSGFACLVALALLAARQLTGPIGADRLVPLALSGGVVLSVLYPSLYDMVFGRLFRRLPLADQEITVILDEDGVRFTGAGFSMFVLWANIAHIALHHDHLLLLYRGGSGVAIPRAAAPSREAFAALATYGEARVAPEALGPGFRP